MAVFTLFSQAAPGGSITADPSSYTLGIQFSVNQAGCTLTGIWFYSAATAGQVPDEIALYTVSGTSLVASNIVTGSWSGGAGSGWIRATFASPPALTSGTAYRACVNVSATSNWYEGTSGYWTSGAGASGLTVGPITAPNDAGASPGQDSYNASATLAYPGTSPGNGSNYWIDPEVTTTGGVPAGNAPATGAAAAGTGAVRIGMTIRGS